MKILGGTNLISSTVHTPYHVSKVSWKFYSGRKAVVSIGVLGAVCVILIVKFKKFLDFDASDRLLAPPKSWIVPGLQNLGNNCFLNVILQALSSGSGFRKYLWEMVEEYGSLSVEEGDDNIPLVNSLTSLVEELCTVRHRRTVLCPGKVMLAIDHYIPNFNLTQQQDAEEALSHLLSSLREEIAEQFVPDGRPLADLLSSPYGRIIITNSSVEESEVQRWRHSFLGPLDGILGSILLCQSCSFQISLDFEMFHTLHVSPPINSDGTIVAGCTLEDCLNQFFLAEHLKNYCCSNCWHTAATEYVLKFAEDKSDIERLRHCNRNDPCDCKTLSSLEGFPWSNSFCRSYKQLSITRSPKIFCIHLQRASYNMFGQSMKLQGHISFPCILDLSSFMDTKLVIKSPESNLQFGRVNMGNQDLRSFPQPKHQNVLLEESISTETKMDVTLPSAPSRHQRYRLVSVVEHFGSGGGGHYAVYRRVTAKIGDEDPAALLDSAIEQWFFISDSEVHSVSEKDVLDASATMLFYERIDEPSSYVL